MGLLKLWLDIPGNTQIFESLYDRPDSILDKKRRINIRKISLRITVKKKKEGEKER